MKIAFGPALPVGTAGEDEYYDIWLTRYTRAEKLLELLAGATPPDLAPTEARLRGRVGAVARGGADDSQVQGRCGRKGSGPGRCAEALEGLVDSGTLSVEHKGKRRFSTWRAVSRKRRVSSESADGSRRGCDVRIGPEGSLRPEALVGAALEAASLDASVARVTRTDILVEIEEGAWARPL